MIRENKKTLIAGSIVILLPLLIWLLMGRDWGAYMVTPLIFLAMYWLSAFATAKDPGQKRQGKKPLRMVLWTIPISSLVVCGVDYLIRTRQDFPITIIFCLLFGIMFMAIGNYLPKCRQNYTIGIKVSWAYTSEENWNATHRFGGKVWFIGGLVIALGSFLPMNWAVPVMIVSVFVLVLLPVGYSYRYYRRQKANGDELAPIANLTSSKFGKFTLVFLVAIAIFVGCILFTGNLRYQFGEDSFTIDASFYDDLTVAYEDIEEIAYQEENYPGFRVWGYGSFRLLMGTFQTGNTQYTRYTYYRPDSAITMTVKGKPVVISGKDPAQTKEIYDTLLQKIED